MSIGFSSSRNSAWIERKMLQYTTFSMKYHQYTLSEIKTQNFTMLEVLAYISVDFGDQRQHSIPNLLTKAINNTQQTCVDVAYEYLQAYNTGPDVRNHLFVVCINVNK